MLLIVIFELVKGNVTFNSVLNIKYCSNKYWTILIVESVFFIILTFVSIIYTSKRSKRNSNKSQSINSIRNIKKSILLCFIVFLIGIISYIAGIGGTLILFPFLVSFGFEPVVLSYTLMFLIFLSKIISVFLNIFQKLII